MEDHGTPRISALFEQYLFNKSFVFGSIIPLILYFLLDRILCGLWPAIICMIYSIIYVFIKLIQYKKIDFFGGISIFILSITLVCLIFLKDDRFFLLKNTIDDFILFIIFGITLFMKKPMIQIIVEEVSEFNQKLKQLEEYREVWKIETIIWMIYYIAWFIVQIFLFFTIRKEILLIVQIIFGKLFFIALLAFSFWYSTRVFSKIQNKYEKNP